MAYWDLFWTFFRVGALTFGGGYAMLPMLQAEVVEKKQWVTEEEIANYYAIGQSTPGIIAVNTATFIGYKEKGILGGIVATLGVAFPSFVIIAIITIVLEQFMHIPAVSNAFSGIRVGVCVLVLNAVIKLLKASVKDFVTVMLFTTVFFVTLFANSSPIIMVVTAGLFGILLRVWLQRKKES